ncbi:hypothetical protein [Flavimarina sp. Hel_I_48]|uniref:hypothetical protein n=1 Tax=Flavimarina sp. Hel_I_48 TaxID=1392488 RepID=UPI00068DD190|nr:hypothetical protein [Flavimarina sp. Hel_I_48]
MKKYLIIAAILLMELSLFAQVKIEETQNDLSQAEDGYIRTFKIFPTSNMWYFIKMNTRTGQMWQIEFDQNESNQLQTPLNSLSLVENQEEVDNRFTLYPTQNTWTFLLLDQINGKIWQMNWDQKPEKTYVKPLDNPHISKKQEAIDYRFALHPTSNDWSFLLLDKINGNFWQINLSKKIEKSEIIPIK